MGAFIRSQVAHNDQVIAYDGAARHHWHTYPNSKSVSMTVHLDPKYNAHLPPMENPVNPPYHWHRIQVEQFTITKGRVIFSVEGEDVVKSKEDGLVSVPPGTYHTFRPDPSSEEEVELLIEAEPDEEDGLNERFFRNAYNYTEDCRKQDVEPSPFQMMLFLGSSDTYPVLPGPKVIGQPAARLLVFLMGTVIGKWLLGYKESYEEYYDPKLRRQQQT